MNDECKCTFVANLIELQSTWNGSFWAFLLLLLLLSFFCHIFLICVAIPRLLKVLGICPEEFCIRAGFLQEVSL